MPHGDATATRLPILWRVVLPAILGAIGLFYSSQAPAGSGGFYAATFFTAAIWLGTWCLWVDRSCFHGHTLKELALGAVIGIGLIALFIVGALMVRLVPFLAALINDLLEVPRVLFLGICLVFHYCLWQVLLPKLGFHLDRGSVSQALVEPCLVPP